MEFEGTIEDIISIIEHDKKLKQSTFVYNNSAGTISPNTGTISHNTGTISPSTGTISPSTFSAPFHTTMNLCSATISEE